MIIKCRCGTPLQVDEDMVGEEIQCPRCHMTMVAPPQLTSAEPNELVTEAPQPTPASTSQAAGRPPGQMSLPAQPGPAATSQPAPGTISANAMASMNLGINSFIVPFVLAIPSILFGLLALRDCRKYRMQGKGMAVTGMILSVVSTLTMGYVIYLAYPWIKQLGDLTKGMKEGGDITKMLGKGMGDMDGAGQLNNPEMKANLILGVGASKFGELADMQTTNRLREIKDMDRLNRIEKALPTAKSWKELLATP